MSITWEQRIALTRRINALWYAEHRGVGWLKAVDFDSLEAAVAHPAERGRITQHRRGQSDVLLRRDMIRLFLNEWLMWNVPESVEAWGRDPAGFHEIKPKEALDVIAEILRISEEDPGSEPAEDAEDYGGGLGYADLRVWFPGALFDAPATAFLLGPSPGRQTVVAMDRDIIGMLWLE
jgi:hypothetical protein